MVEHRDKAGARAHENTPTQHPQPLTTNNPPARLTARLITLGYRDIRRLPDRLTVASPIRHRIGRAKASIHRALVG